MSDLLPYTGLRYQHRATGGIYDKGVGRVITPIDPAWYDYHQWTQAGNIPEEDTTPAPVIVPKYEPPDFQAMGAARELRKLEKEAQTNPILAELLKRNWL